jgi:hypothetical protein
MIVGLVGYVYESLVVVEEEGFDIRAISNRADVQVAALQGCHTDMCLGDAYLHPLRPSDDVACMMRCIRVVDIARPLVSHALLMVVYILLTQGVFSWLLASVVRDFQPCKIMHFRARLLSRDKREKC